MKAEIQKVMLMKQKTGTDHGEPQEDTGTGLRWNTG